MKRGLVFLFFLGFLNSGCTSPQLIRSSNYYPLSQGFAVSKEEGGKWIQHHPVFTETESSKEGKPAFQGTVNYYFFGMFPSDPYIAVDPICDKQPFRQAYADNTLAQGLISIVTLGVYTPRRVRIWCGAKNI